MDLTVRLSGFPARQFVGGSLQYAAVAVVMKTANRMVGICILRDEEGYLRESEVD